MTGSAIIRLSTAALLGLLMSVSAASAADTPTPTPLPDLTAVRAKLYSEDYRGAADDLLELSKTVQHADLYNLLGYSLRNLDDLEGAAKWYREALYYDPDHRNALEYQGELFIRTGDLTRAKANLERLHYLCPQGCPEVELLEKAVKEAKPS